jgi:prophage DNA circulation protein
MTSTVAALAVGNAQAHDAATAQIANVHQNVIALSDNVNAIMQAVISTNERVACVEGMVMTIYESVTSLDTSFQNIYNEFDRLDRSVDNVNARVSLHCVPKVSTDILRSRLVSRRCVMTFVLTSVIT